MVSREGAGQLVEGKVDQVVKELLWEEVVELLLKGPLSKELLSKELLLKELILMELLLKAQEVLLLLAVLVELLLLLQLQGSA